ncbi:MAG: cold-shock protein [Agriterribacter sp.]
MATSWNKKERENKKKEERKKKQERKLERKDNAGKGKSLDDMMAYLDENGNLTSVPPDPRRKVEIDVESIEIGVPKRPEPTEDELIRKGIVTFFNPAKGFGFIEDKQNGQRIFVHQSASQSALQEGMAVQFEIEKGPRGLTAARVSTDK